MIARELNWKGSSESDGIGGIFGKRTTSPLKGPHEMVPSMRFRCSHVTTPHVPFVVLGGSIDLRIMIGEPTLSLSMCVAFR